jgi:site-specific DNA-methyltransferase (adenine-specific)
MKNYNPDVLSCLANLSNDEIFTPPALANQILDMLPDEIWHNSQARFLDPACKSGVFLREIAKRLINGLEKEIPDLQERLNHIFTQQLYGIAITDLTSSLSRRSVYCSKTANSKYSVCTTFRDEAGKIRFRKMKHTWKDGRCIYCGASQSVYDRGDDYESHAYEFIHTDDPNIIFNKMKFDVIIGNPPYQLNDGGGSNGISAKPIYQLFISQAEKLNPKFLIMIIPSRWFAGGKGLDRFRAKMLNDGHIRTLVHYPKSRDCFQGVDIAGGVCYFLKEKNYDGDCKYVFKDGDKQSVKYRKLNEFNILIPDNIGVDIVHKVYAIKGNFLSDVVLARNSFGFTTSSRGEKYAFVNSIKLITSDGINFVKRTEVTKNIDLIDKYKVSIGTLNPDRAGVNNAKDGMMNVTTKVKLLNPGEVVTETYIIIDNFDNKVEAENCVQYLCTKFARYLVSITLSSMHIVKSNFQFVPVQDFSESWTDEKLYKKYGLNKNEISYIENKIRPMD